ncbi:MAG: 3-hydroxyacyl-CoA dehydrogenase NAD-binding domain-containing protein [Ruminiclostridium sp.]
MNTIENIAVIGSGTMGCQIALQCALFGYKVRLLSRSEESRKKAKEMLMIDIGIMRMDKVISSEQIAGIINALEFKRSLIETIKEADLIIETITENRQAKEQLYKEISAVYPPEAILVTNTSTFLPSMFTEFVADQERYLALHFHSNVWKSNIVDIMGHTKTSIESIERVSAFAVSIGQIPVIMKKERPFYVFNSMIFEVIRTALQLVTEEVVELNEVDLVWKKILGVQTGPFELMDVIGLDLISEIIDCYKDASNREVIEKISNYIDSYKKGGKLGRKTGEGFYKY